MENDDVQEATYCRRRPMWSLNPSLPIGRRTDGIAGAPTATDAPASPEIKRARYLSVSRPNCLKQMEHGEEVHATALRGRRGEASTGGIPAREAETGSNVDRPV